MIREQICKQTEALKRLAALVETILNPPAGGNVIPMHRWSSIRLSGKALTLRCPQCPESRCEINPVERVTSVAMGQVAT
jgi:hypothetical protein